MLVTLLIVTLILFTAYVLNRYYIYPKRMMNHYANLFTQKGYKVKVLPFQFMNAPHIQRAIDDIELRKDTSYAFKHDYVPYDLIISHFIGDPFLGFLNPHLGKHLTTMEGVMNMPKNT